MITSKQITATSVSVPEKVYTSSTTGAAIGGGVTGQNSAITTMILCNIGAPTISDESINSVNVNVYLVKSGDTAGTDNLIVSNLTVPAGETVFFSDEKIILDSGDEVWIGTSAASLITATISTLPV
jgi:hypothetical protein